MAQLKTLICKGCGAAIGLDQLERCPYCKTQNFVMGSIDPLTMETQKVQEMITFYKGKIESNAKDTNSLFALGLFYLALNNYRFAQQNFLKAVELTPLDPDVYYYYALSLIGGRSPKNLDHNEAVQVEQQIRTAVGMERKRKYLALLAFVEQGAFLGNGLQAKDNPIELIQEAMTIMPETGELDEIIIHAQPNDKESKKFMTMLSTGKKQETATEGKDEKAIGGITSEYVEFPLSRDNKFTQKGYDELVEDEDNRESFMEHLHEPDTPHYYNKELYPIWFLLKTLVIAFVSFIVLVVVFAMTGWDKNTDESREFVVIDENTPDSVRVQDSLFIAEHWMLQYRLPDKSGKYKDGYFGLPSDTIPRPYLIVGNVYSMQCFKVWLIIISPFILWFIMAIILCVRCYRERKDTNDLNNSLKANYKADLEKFNTRPSIQDYLVFCRNYLGKDSISYGDVVSQVLNKFDISEGNIVGKILFVNYFETQDIDRDWDLESPEEILNYVYYTIAIPQKDQLFIVHNTWDTTHNEQDKPKVRSVFYGNISEILINPDSNQLEIHTNRDGVIAIDMPPAERVNILNYQSNNVKSILDYSITRTGNVLEFFNALSTLIRTYQK